MATFLKKKLSIKKPSKGSTGSSIISTTTETSTSLTSKSSQSTKEHKKHSSPKSISTKEIIEDQETENETDNTEISIHESKNETSLLPDIEKNPLEEIALTAAGLGILFGCSIATLPFSKCLSASIYISSLSIFHFLEFYITAKYNPKKVHKESFIINNGSAYTLAHTFALSEFAIEYFFFPRLKISNTWIKTIGIVLILIGQFVRSLAMKTAGQSFSHLVLTKKEKEHQLVTAGIYSISRHPSYDGFFWWAIGTQLVLLNPISLIAFIFVLWNFFNNRIGYEEQFLIKFFGDQYVNYRNSTPSYIPLIG